MHLLQIKSNRGQIDYIKCRINSICIQSIHIIRKIYCASSTLSYPSLPKSIKIARIRRTAFFFFGYFYITETVVPATAVLFSVSVDSSFPSAIMKSFSLCFTSGWVRPQLMLVVISRTCHRRHSGYLQTVSRRRAAFG